MPVQSPAAKPMLMMMTGMGYCAQAVPSRVKESVMVSSIQIPTRSSMDGSSLSTWMLSASIWWISSVNSRVGEPVAKKRFVASSQI